MQKGRLRAASIIKLPNGFHPDGNGLYLQVGTAGSGNRSWIFRYKLRGRTRYMGLGGADSVTLARARELADAARRLAAERIDPIDHRRAQQAAAVPVPIVTFADCGKGYVAAHSGSWKNQRHKPAFESSLAREILPTLGALPVSTVETADVMRALVPIWNIKPNAADKARARIEAILDYAKAHGYRSGDNPARWRGHLSNLLGKPKAPAHHRAMPYREAPAFIQKLRKHEGRAARALAFLILTATRSSETLGAQWDEIDFATATWVVPAQRMKGGKPHKVPLSKRAIELLQEMAAQRESAYVFPGHSKATMEESALRKFMARVGSLYVPHGFRSTFRDWAAEYTDHPREIAELALAHMVGNDVERAYRRTDLFDKRRALMDEWASYLG